jgi:small subunit ribosomal protein S1
VSESTVFDAFEVDGSFEDLLQNDDYIKQDLKEGLVVKGVIVDINQKDISVDIGAKSIGYISVIEFRKDGEVEKGDVVDVFIEKLENRKGELILSRTNARRSVNWNILKDKMETKEEIDGFVLGKVKGGYAVDFNDIITFLPRSQVDTKLITDDLLIVNKTERLQVLKIDELRGNIVVSRRAVIESKRAEERDKVLEKINVGDILEGMVKNITDYGAFIDFGSFDGLLHLTDISWFRIKHPSEVLTIGQNVKVQVIKYDPVSKRVSIGMKQLQENPWSNIEERYPVGTVTKGKVTNITNYGAFVCIEEGVEGLVHASEMTWVKSNVIPSKFLKLEQEVEVMILDISGKNHRISLGIKQCSENPWQKFSEKYKVGDIVEGVAKNSTEFGTFVIFDEGIEGLIHNSDFAWESSDEKAKNIKKDSKINVMILGSSHEKERIALGIKQLEYKNFKNDLKRIKVGEIFSCTVIGTRKESVEVELDLGLKGIIKRSDLSKDKKNQHIEKFEAGDRVDAAITQFNEVDGRLLLSIAKIELDEQESYIYDAKSQKGETIGSIIGDALQSKDETKDN